ncbi:hypothetical protein RI367_004550 [Sorochytrium milnesiophthora]
MPLLLLLLLSLLAAVAVAAAAAETPHIDQEFRKVTCGSILKLTHASTNFKLHSHEISYGSGSRQQSTTGFPNRDDPNSLWRVDGAHGESCIRGEPIQCNDVVRLQHVATKNYLHSHLHKSPLSQNQEVSAYDGLNAGDNWKVVCKGTKSHWSREEQIQLAHGETGYFLYASSQYAYRSPINGQLEISAVKSASQECNWTAEEGIYFADRNEL